MADAMTPWVEKYRPKTVDDVSQQQQVISTLKGAIKSGSLPHLLFYGPPGTGKTTTILALARNLYGSHLSKRVLELNASDDRTIEVVRTKIKDFARGIAGGTTAEGLKLPPFKIIILDEADSMTAGAQAALRRTMETHSKVTRFCLVCNYISRIADPLTSRCAKFRFLPLSDESIHARLRFIADKEGVPITDEICHALTETSGGDMRKAITYLQNAVHLYGAEDLTADVIYDVAGIVPPSALQQFWESCLAKRFEAMKAAVSDLICNGYAAEVLLKQVLTDTVGNKYLKVIW
eukprot:INCI17546.7.p1 GENE.INCI17546.7~~INCI17546.7.p1  ORF type:complete len:292 (+),score=45.54 INCI17546.7:224-1099(+)